MFEAASWNARRGVGVGKGGALGSVVLKRAAVRGVSSVLS